ncbi:MobA/MobL family protein [Bacillus amyloliquefaciens]|uniref:MobA/MobL family protein n=1 Tax=Bacillus amyloliquefaciens TaxID=1390 RepID=UPI002FF6C0CF
MSTYHFSARYISKSSQSAIAKAAYVSNEPIYSERDQEVKKYKTRIVKPESFILAPSHAPDWVYDRETLWNEVEKVEKQWNAVVMREVEIALPIELNNEEQTDLVREFVQENFISDGMVADVNIHRDRAHNPHAHILLTVRPFQENGKWIENKSKKIYITDENGNPVLNKNGKQKTYNRDLTGWKSKEKLIKWRKNLAEKINESYKQKGIKKFVSHLSYEEQGLDKKPKQRLTKSEYFVEKKAKENAEINNESYVPVTTYGKVNYEIEKYNNEIKLINKEIEELEKLKMSDKEIVASEFEDIRNNITLNKYDYESIQFIKKRQKVQYVDYESSQTALDNISYWKKNIDKKVRAISRLEEMLKTVRDLYENNDDRIIKYGFSRNGFIERYNEKMNSLNKEYEKVTKEVSRYKESYKLIKHGHELQKQIVNKEFEFLYPKYKDFTSIDSFEINEIKNKYVDLFKRHKVVENSILEFDSYDLFSSQEEQKFRDVIWDCVADYRNESKTYYSLSKKVDLLEKDYLSAVKDTSLSEDTKLEIVYGKAVDYLTVKREFNILNKKYENTKNTMMNSLIELYGEGQKEVIEKIPDRVKVLLLERFLKERSVEELNVNLEEIDWKLKEHNKADYSQEGWSKDWESKGGFEYKTQQQSASMGGLLSDLIDSAKQNEGSYDDLEYKRKRAKRRKKLTKEELLELE